ncbi:MAG: hypothetical protein DCC55_06775 [Chloroflexi bacterium]|nr:MAG: hypothetical protein DCC55_06775 [Chloroflexota bacterium]
MQIQQIRPTLLQLTVHSFELATLVAAARWVAGGCEGELPPEAVEQMRQVLARYDEAWQQHQEAPVVGAGRNHAPA